MSGATGDIGAAEQDSELPPLHAVTTEHGLVRAHALAALAGVVLSALFGIVVAIKFVDPGFLGSQAWATWGLLRYDHTQGILFAWLCNAFLAFLYHAVPRLAGRSVLSKRLGWILFWVWNLGMVLPGWALIEANLPQRLLAIKPLEWTEFPLLINLVTEICLGMIVAQFAIPLLRGSERNRLYASAWYLIGGGVFSMLAFPMGSLVPEFVPGVIGAAYRRIRKQIPSGVPGGVYMADLPQKQIEVFHRQA